MWAERFNGDTSDLFARQDEINTRIAVALELEMPAAEAARPTDHPDALDYILRARAAARRPPTPEARAEWITMYEQALALDPQSVEAQSRLANSLAGRMLANMTHSAAADIKRAIALSEAWRVQNSATTSQRSV